MYGHYTEAYEQKARRVTLPLSKMGEGQNYVFVQSRFVDVMCLLVGS